MIYGLALVGITSLAVGYWGGRVVAYARRKVDIAYTAKLRAENSNQLLATFAAANQARDLWEKKSDTARVTILNVAQFAILWNMDLSALLNALNDTEPGWHRQLHARVLALTIYECVEDFTALLGKKFREAVADVAGPEQVEQINPVSGGINQFWKRHQSTLKEIRVCTIGHRDHDAKVQLAVLQRLSADEVDQMGLELMQWTNDLLGVLSSIIDISKTTINDSLND